MDQGTIKNSKLFLQLRLIKMINNIILIEGIIKNNILPIGNWIRNAKEKRVEGENDVASDTEVSGYGYGFFASGGLDGLFHNLRGSFFIIAFN